MGISSRYLNYIKTDQYKFINYPNDGSNFSDLSYFIASLYLHSFLVFTQLCLAAESLGSILILN